MILGPEVGVLDDTHLACVGLAVDLDGHRLGDGHQFLAIRTAVVCAARVALAAMASSRLGFLLTSAMTASGETTRTDGTVLVIARYCLWVIRPSDSRSCRSRSVNWTALPPT